MNERPRCVRLALACLLALSAVACGDAERPAEEPVEAGTEVSRIVLPPPAPEPARTVALLVGIDRYAPGSPPAKSPLRGCGNDVRALRAALIEQFDFASEDVVVLLDEQATHEAVVRAFCEHLIGRAGPGTEALFYFSGHGSRAPDLSGDEGFEGLDSTFLAYDSRSGERAGEYDLSDDELGSLVAALATRGARATIVTDSCHSGGGLRSGAGSATRSVPVGARGLDPDERDAVLPFFPSDVQLLDDPSLVLGADTVHLAACGDRELAQELEVDGVAHGALTWALLQALELATSETTYEALAHELAARMAFTAPGQSAWVEGVLERRLFDGAARSLPGFACRLSGDGLLVQAGWLMGLSEGSRLSIHDGTGEHLLGQAVVQRARSTSASARWEGESPPSALPPAMRAVEAERGAGQPLLAVSVELELDPDAPEALAGVLPCAPGDEHDYRLREVDGAAQLETREGNVLWRAAPRADPDSSAALENAIARERRWLGLTRLGLERGSRPVEARFREPSELELSELSAVMERELESAGVQPADGALGASARSIGGLSDLTWRLGMIDVTNPHAEELFVSVLSLAEDRSIHVIWPPRHQRGNRLAPGTTDSISVGVVAPRNWRLERPMRDRYLIVSTSNEADLSVFEHEAVLRGGPDSSDLPELLQQALHPTRGGSVRVEPEGWGVTTLDLLVSLPAR